MGKRANDLTLTLQQTFEPELRLLVDRVNDGTPDDWVESRAMKLKTIGNTYVQGSVNNVNWDDRITSSHNYFRISTDGGSTWKELTADFLRDGITNKYYTDAKVSANPDVAANTNSRHSHSNKSLLDSINSAGDGTRFLANDGTYKLVTAQHNLLTGLSNDDHPQYLLTAGTRNLTGVIAYNTHPTFTTDTQLVDKKYVDEVSNIGTYAFEITDGVLYAVYDDTIVQPAYEVTNIGNVLGPQGTQGLQGSQGNQGDNGTQGNQGTVGPQGNQGVAGVGTQGTQGTQGAAGTGLTNKGDWVSGTNYLEGDYVFAESSDTVGVNSMWIAKNDVTNSTVVPKSDLTNWVEFQAPQGEQGVQGVQGNIGVQGNQGLQGTQGVQGTIGVQGNQGYQGVIGVQGVVGDQGPNGDTGERGFQGYQGVQGSAGVQGSTGSTGTQGVQGSVGVQGSIGVQGVQGVQGTIGVQGIQGVQGESGNAFAFEIRDGDLYVIYDNEQPALHIDEQGYLIQTIIA